MVHAVNARFLRTDYASLDGAEFRRSLRSKFHLSFYQIAGCIAVTILATVIVAVYPASCATGDAQKPKDVADASSEDTGIPVEIDGKPILAVYAPIGGFSPKERAEAIQERIISLGKNSGVPVETIHAEDRGTWTEILAGNDRIMGITEGDAKGAGHDRAQLAAEYTEIIRHVVEQYREDHTLRHLIRAAASAIITTLAFVLVLFALFWIRRKLRLRLEARFVHMQDLGTAKALGLEIGNYLGHPLLALGRIAFWIIILVLVEGYSTVLLRFFPATKYASYQLTNWLFSEVERFGKAVIGYVPNLILLAAICLITSYLVKINGYVFGEIRDERLRIHGFYPDWAEPTAKLVRVLILVASVIVAFPYLPGSQSPAFKGISVFVGVLLSLGSTSAVAHAVAGTILTYMRAFQVGDFVRIGTDVGDVVEKTLLVTRVCTQKNEIITIPNGTVLGGVVVNYSAEARKRGVIFHTAVTIGYSASWRQVHDLLIASALATEDVLHEPPPFVLQTALNDFYVSYELNAYTAKPRNMQFIYSALHQNIQDKFNEAGVEINSPHYASLRDGNETTIPQSYLPSDYKRPVFEMRQVDHPSTASSPEGPNQNSNKLHEIEAL